MTRIVFIDNSVNSECDLSIEQSILGAGVELEHHCCGGNEELILAASRDADVVVADIAPLTRNVIEQMRRCRLICVAGTGYSNVDLSAAEDAGISVCAIDEYCTDEVADHVLLLMLALRRQLPAYHAQVQTENRWQYDSLAGLARMRDMTLGIIGFGKIGKAVARRAHGFGMKILTHDHHPDDGTAAALHVRFCDLPTLLAESDIVSLNCNLSNTNERMIGASAFRQMQRNPILINCARGELIDEAALIAALDAGQISGAGLDVLSDESQDLSSSKLTGRSNVILTPHIAFYSDASLLESRKVSASNIRHFLHGQHERVRKYIHHA